MRIEIYERRYWDLANGKVRSVFDSNRYCQLLNCLPSSNDFFIWIDSEPFAVVFDISVAGSVATELRNAEESAKCAIA